MRQHRSCECKNCKKKNEKNHLCKYLKRGDCICVSSFGERLQKTGIFLLIKDSCLMWFDEKHQLNQTSLQGIHIEKRP
ncbi:hypothetical protein EEL30_00380 (plasmid) [Brevibacillus laterosporus]|uniref:Uncharacterized protein n=1 Tax=Brevibacillus laterosporus TaxID=1465 RepID=A0A518V1V2_BRELA|nr:hypothetical protein EEL30_00380 [Brevibacillus laterosporus]